VTSRIIVLLCALIPSFAWGIDTEPAFDDPTLQARYEHLTNELRCLVCQNQSIADSNAGLAADLRRELRELLAAGKSDAEVLKFMTDRYGDFVLYRPPVVPRTWLLWGAPAILLILGLGAAVRVIRRRSRLPIDEASDPESDAA
jgi:cytochrome c-type biogenesis protein CcmH